MTHARPTKREVDEVLAKIRERLGSNFDAAQAIRAYTQQDVCKTFNASFEIDDTASEVAALTPPTLWGDDYIE